MDLTEEELASLMGDSMDEEDEFREPPTLGSLSSHSTATLSCPGFDRQAGDLWIYPTNYPVRDYQFAIVERALMQNTLVCLPTGLGKTFIAAVVMYNFYRWYPKGKIIFMAPTKPLVNQQIDACYRIMGIPQSDSTFLTGQDGQKEREQTWREKRVFFLTPQVMSNDLNRGYVNHDDVKCLVIDEAHKATGNYAYVVVVTELMRRTKDFRILALSATPGKDLETVQRLIFNLAVAHVEIRTEDSPDIRAHSFNRVVEEKVLDLSPDLEDLKNRFFRVVGRVLNRLKTNKVIFFSANNVENLSHWLVLQSREQFRQNPPAEIANNNAKRSLVETDFHILISLVMASALLLNHSARTFYKNLKKNLQERHLKAEYARSEDFQHLVKRCREKFGDESLTDLVDEDAPPPVGPDVLVAAHPKLEVLRDVITEHFRGVEQTRVMIFASYRESVAEIVTLLNHFKPAVKCMAFVGQSSGASSSAVDGASSGNNVSKGLTQKEQLEVVRRFKDGGYNTLVATCVGEEGLDIGEVDLIVCYDSSKSATRMVQRMGRTGRKRDGRIVVLLTRGKEEKQYRQAQLAKKGMDSTLQLQSNVLNFYTKNPRMVPEDLLPKCHKMYITVKEPAQKAKAKNAGKKKTAMQQITNWTENTDDKAETECWKLTLAEQEEYEREFATDSQTLKIPVASLRSHRDRTPSTLNDYALWQSRRQGTKHVGSAKRSTILVDTMQAIERMADDSVDIYGEEMKLFLRDEDKFASPQKGIHQFFSSVGQPSPSTKPSANPKKKTMKKAKSSIEKTYKELIEADEDDLPALDDLLNRGTKSASSVDVATESKRCSRDLLRQFEYVEEEEEKGEKDEEVVARVKSAVSETNVASRDAFPLASASTPSLVNIEIEETCEVGPANEDVGEEEEEEEEEDFFPSPAEAVFPELITMTQAIQLISNKDDDLVEKRERETKGLRFPEPAPVSSISADLAALESLGDSLQDSGVDFELIWKEVEDELKAFNETRSESSDVDKQTMLRDKAASVCDQMGKRRSGVLDAPPPVTGDASRIARVCPVVREKTPPAETLESCPVVEPLNFNLMESDSDEEFLSLDLSKVETISSGETASKREGAVVSVAVPPRASSKVRPMAPSTVPTTRSASIPSTAPAAVLLPAKASFPSTAPASIPSMAPASVPSTASASIPSTAQASIPSTAPFMEESLNFDMFADDFDEPSFAAPSRKSVGKHSRVRNISEKENAPVVTSTFAEAAGGDGKNKSQYYDSQITLSQAMNVLQESTQKPLTSSTEGLDAIDEKAREESNDRRDSSSTGRRVDVAVRSQIPSTSTPASKLAKTTSVPSTQDFSFDGDFVDDDVDMEALAKALHLKEQEEALQRYSQVKESTSVHRPRPFDGPSKRSFTNLNDDSDGDGDDDDEESLTFINLPKKRRRMNMILSPETGVGPKAAALSSSVAAATSTNKKSLDVSSSKSSTTDSDESPIVRRQRAKKAAKTLQATQAETSSTSETSSKTGDDSAFVTPVKTPKKKKRSSKQKTSSTRGGGFIDGEAELSGSDDEGDDLEDSQMDKDLASLIHDGSPELASQAFRSPPPDERAMYLRSTRSPEDGRDDNYAVAANGKFKLRYDVGAGVDVYSQRPDPDFEETYEHDSFVVDNECEETCRLMGDEVSPDKSMPSYMEERLTRRQRKIIEANKMLETEDDEDAEEAKAGRKDKRRRVVRMIDSSDDEDDLPAPIRDEEERDPKPSAFTSPESQGFRSGTVLNASTPIQVDKRIAFAGKSSSKSLTCVFQKERVDGAESAGRAATSVEDVTVGENSSSIGSTMNPVVSSTPSKKPPQQRGNNEPLASVEARLRSGPLAPRMPATSTAGNQPTSLLPILIDSRQLASGSDVISRLRLESALRPRIVQLQNSCDYVISSRVAAVRVSLADAGTSAGQQQTVKRVRALAACCEKPILIVEKGKGDEKADGAISRTKTLDHLSYLVFAAKHTKMLYADNQKETADLIKRLALAESKKDKALPSINSKDSSEATGDRKFQFLFLLQGMPPAAAVNYVAKFPSIRSVLTSPSSELAEKGVTPTARANKVSAIFKKRVNDFGLND